MVNHTQFWSIQGVMNEGDLVRLKTRYPIWLYSFGLSDGDFGGVITKIDEKKSLSIGLKSEECVLCNQN